MFPTLRKNWSTQDRHRLGRNTFNILMKVVASYKIFTISLHYQKTGTIFLIDQIQIIDLLHCVS